jgi:hypothetical protein
LDKLMVFRFDSLSLLAAETHPALLSAKEPLVAEFGCQRGQRKLSD